MVQDLMFPAVHRWRPASDADLSGSYAGQDKQDFGPKGL